jgi:hypothetical protein
MRSDYETDSPMVNIYCVSECGIVGIPYLFENVTINGTSYLKMLQEFYEDNMPLSIHAFG